MLLYFLQNKFQTVMHNLSDSYIHQLLMHQTNLYFVKTKKKQDYISPGAPAPN